MNSRIEIRKGSIPVLFIVPHIEENTAIIAEYVSSKLDAYYVINKGWERSDSVDCLNDKANCNNLDHCFQDVVKDEFIDPIIRYVSEIDYTFPQTYVFILHGATFETYDVLLGCGSKSHPSCDDWRKNALISFLQSKSIRVAQSKTKYAGASMSNLNQLFKQDTSVWNHDDNIHSMQLEINKMWRLNQVNATVFASALYQAISSLLCLKNKGFNNEVKFDIV